MTEPLTPAQIAGRMTAALATITGLWGDMLQPIGHNGHGGDGDPRIITICNLRQEVNWQVRGWCQVLIEDHGLTDGIPDGHDTLGLCGFLRQHIQLMAEHEAGPDALQELEDCAEACENAVYGHRRKAVSLGECSDPTCGGTVRLLDHLDDEGRQQARCTGECHVTRTVGAWAEVMGVQVKRVYTADEVIDMAYRYYGQRLTPKKITWAVKNERLKLAGDCGERAFLAPDVMRYLTSIAS